MPLRSSSILDPPGRNAWDDLQQQIVQMRRQIVAGRAQTAKMQLLASKVQSGSTQSGSFENEILFRPSAPLMSPSSKKFSGWPTRPGFRNATLPGRKNRISGTADLTLLNNQANYEGSYTNLMKFLYQADHSPMLLMLDRLQAAPQQKNNQINTQIRFQAIVRELPAARGPMGNNEHPG